MRTRLFVPTLLAALAAAFLSLAPTAGAATPAAAGRHPGAVPPAHRTTVGGVDLGPNVYVFTPDMSTSTIQATVDAVAAQQVGNQFGEQRYALLFTPGTYGTPAEPLVFQVGYYTDVMGLGRDPGDVVINGSVNVYNQCDASGCLALNNFWRSLSNLSIDIAGGTDCRGDSEFWATSQAASLRRVQISGGTVSLMDYCTAGPQFASGGFIADSATDASVINGSQQQFLVRNAQIGGWSNGVWNQVFVGVQGAPAEAFGSGTNNYTTLDRAPVQREKPYLYLDDADQLQVFVPAAATDSAGPSWSDTASTPGTSVPVSRFLVATPATTVDRMDQALDRGKHLLLTPGVYRLPRTVQVTRPDTVVLGLGLPTLRPTAGLPAMAVAGVPGTDVSDVIFDAGRRPSPTLLKLRASTRTDAARPTGVHDVYFRVGGPYPGAVDTAFTVNTSRVVLDNVWSWRADHGVPGSVGWTVNEAPTGLRVTGADVTAYGLFVEHYQDDQVVWDGARGRVYMFQNEMPYDPPSQAAWRTGPDFLGHAALVVRPEARGFRGYGMGSYSFFNQGVDIHATQAFTLAPAAGARVHDVLTVFLDGSGGIDSVVNRTGAPVSSANPGTPSTVTDFPAPAP